MPDWQGGIIKKLLTVQVPPARVYGAADLPGVEEGWGGSSVLIAENRSISRPAYPPVVLLPWISCQGETVQLL